MSYDESVHYTQRDWLDYHFYTPELLMEIPRVSDKYGFSFNNIFGPDIHVFTIRYYGVTDVGVIRNYLKTQGYDLKKSCYIKKAECWGNKNNIDVVSITTHPSEK